MVPRDGRGGGLAFFWKPSINLRVEDSGKYYIDAIINKNTENAWPLIGFYGEPETARKVEAWKKLRFLNSQFHGCVWATSIKSLYKMKGLVVQSNLTTKYS